MSTSPTVTLFAQPADLRQPPTAFVASILIHAAVVSITSFGILYTPRIDTRAAAERLMVRRLDLNVAPEQAPRTARGAIYYPGPHLSALRARSAHLRAPGGKPEAHAPTLRLAANAKPSPQTLLQPDLLTHVTLAEKIPLPEVMIWTPRIIPVKNIVAPLPSPPTTAEVRPSLHAPNQELNLSDMDLAASDTPSLNQMTLPGTTSPVVVQGPQLAPMAPTTVSQLSQKPTPTALLSLSNIHMPVGTMILPPVNETAAASVRNVLTPGEAANSALAGTGASPVSDHGNGAGQNVASAVHAPSATPALSSAHALGAAAGNPEGAAAAPTEVSVAGSGQGGQGSETNITLPQNGQFGAVVVGDSIQDEFPEMSGIWSGRMAYTVYLHVGLDRSWILQYALPLTADAEAGGNIDHLEAPWPYNIVRPNLAPGSIDADALMIHGFVNRQGRFDQLSIVFPPDFAQAQFVLDALDHWQFRPASEDGHAVRVEVLLIIPEELD